jgi:hypothetical protein
MMQAEQDGTIGTHLPSIGYPMNNRLAVVGLAGNAQRASVNTRKEALNVEDTGYL